jgi:DNA-nicking Smr family endonuclease
VRSLSPEESALWRRVTATIRPLSRDVIDQPSEKSDEKQKPVKTVTARHVRRPLQPATALGRVKLGTSLDRSWDKRLRSGSVEPDRVLDLHGMNLDSAWRAIDEGLERAIQRGERVVLLITGHHRPGEPPVQRGKIRAAVHDWLGASRHAADIAAVRDAHKRHGGGGSLYLILRRR